MILLSLPNYEGKGMTMSFAFQNFQDLKDFVNGDLSNLNTTVLNEDQSKAFLSTLNDKED